MLISWQQSEHKSERLPMTQTMRHSLEAEGVRSYLELSALPRSRPFCHGGWPAHPLNADVCM